VFKVGSASDEYPLTISGFIGIPPTDPFVTVVDTMARSSAHMIMIMTNGIVVTVQHNMAKIKVMEDGGILDVGILIPTSNTNLLSMGPYTLLTDGTI